MTKIVSYFDDLYAPLFRIMLTSFLDKNKWFNDSIIVFDWGISKQNKFKSLEIYDKIYFLDVDKNNYDISEEAINKFYFAKNFQKFEFFKLSYKKIIIFDADLVFLDDVKELFDDYNDGFYVDYNEPTDVNPIVPYPDTGLMVIDEKYLTMDNYKKCIKKIKNELKKDVSDDATKVSNEWIIHDVFINELMPIKNYLRISDIDQDLSNRKILGAPEYKPYLNDKRYMDFVNKNLLPWEHKDEIRRQKKFIKLLKEKNLWKIMENL